MAKSATVKNSEAAAAAATQGDTKAPAPANPPAPPAPPKPPVQALLANELWAREAGIKFNTWEVVPPVGTPFENLLQREFWANVSQRMRMGDTIIAVARDGAWWAELVVWDAGQNWAIVSQVSKLERPDYSAAPGVEAEFEIVRDPIDGVCVKSRKTGVRVKTSFPNHEDARRWIIDHQKALRI
jgi:hypothetical protein